MSILKTHQQCPKCGHKECATFFEDGGIFCHSSCGFVKAEGGGEPVREHETYSFKTAPYRKIKQETQAFYNVSIGFNEEGVAKEVLYQYPHKIKRRILPKDFSKNFGFTNNYLFGMDKFPGGGQIITVVEGEDDTLAAYDILDGRRPVVGVPGSESIKSVLKNTECRNFLNSYERIYVATDGDEAGDSCASVLAKAFPSKTYRVRPTDFKDACGYLEAGKKREFFYVWHDAVKYVPPNILNTPEQFKKLYSDSPDHLFAETGIHEWDAKLKGIMRGYFTVLKAQTGVGKTELMRKIEYSLLSRGISIGSWHLEESKVRALLGLVSYHLNDDLTRRDLIESKNKNEEVLEAIGDLTKDENLYQFFMAEDDGADELIDQIRFLSEVCDVKYIFFEPIQDVIAGRTESSKEELLADLSIRLSKLAADLNIAIVTIAHTNDDNEIKYCRMIGQRAGIIVRLERDKNSTDPAMANTLWLHVEKNRPLSDLGPAGELHFDKESFTLKEEGGLFL